MSAVRLIVLSVLSCATAKAGQLVGVAGSTYQGEGGIAWSLKTTIGEGTGQLLDSTQIDGIGHHVSISAVYSAPEQDEDAKGCLLDAQIFLDSSDTLRLRVEGEESLRKRLLQGLWLFADLVPASAVAAPEVAIERRDSTLRGSATIALFDPRDVDWAMAAAIDVTVHGRLRFSGNRGVLAFVVCDPGLPSELPDELLENLRVPTVQLQEIRWGSPGDLIGDDDFRFELPAESAWYRADTRRSGHRTTSIYIRSPSWSYARTINIIINRTSVHRTTDEAVLEALRKRADSLRSGSGLDELRAVGINVGSSEFEAENIVTSSGRSAVRFLWTLPAKRATNREDMYIAGQLELFNGRMMFLWVADNDKERVESTLGVLAPRLQAASVFRDHVALVLGAVAIPWVAILVGLTVIHLRRRRPRAHPSGDAGARAIVLTPALLTELEQRRTNALEQLRAMLPKRSSETPTDPKKRDGIWSVLGLFGLLYVGLNAMRILPFGGPPDFSQMKHLTASSYTGPQWNWHHPTRGHSNATLLKLRVTDFGIAVASIAAGATLQEIVRPNDRLLSINGERIDNLDRASLLLNNGPLEELVIRRDLLVLRFAMGNP